MTSPQGKILVVDDDPLNLLRMSRDLQKQGHAVATVSDGPQALERLGAESFDVVLLDLIMPEVDGIEVLREMKRDSILREIPVIMISALDELDSVIACIELGAEDYLNKPFRPALLRARLNASLVKKQLRDLELAYIEQVKKIGAAVSDIEAGVYRPEMLDDVAERSDVLGKLARHFQAMAVEIKSREGRLQDRVRELEIEVDLARQEEQIEGIVETDFFRDLQRRASKIRERNRHGR